MSDNNSEQQDQSQNSHQDQIDIAQNEQQQYDNTEGTSFSFREKQRKNNNRKESPARDKTPEARQAQGIQRDIDQSSGQKKIMTSAKKNLQIEIEDNNAIEVEDHQQDEKLNSNLSDENDQQFNGVNNFEDTAKFRDNKSFKISPNTTPGKSNKNQSQEYQKPQQKTSSREINDADLIKQQREIESLIEETKKAMAEDESDNQEDQDDEDELPVTKNNNLKKISSKNVKIRDQAVDDDGESDQQDEDEEDSGSDEEEDDNESVSEDESEKQRKMRAQEKVRAQMPTQRKKKFEVNYTVDVPMVDEDQNKGLEESMKVAQDLKDEDEKLQAEIDHLHSQGDHPAEEGEPISKYVNQQYATTLQEMGFSKTVAEKALFMTQAQGSTVEAALQWIDQHQEDADFNEELRIMGYAILVQYLHQCSATEEVKPKSNLSKEEKIKKAKELQDAIRKKRVEEEKRLAEEQERNRIRITKDLAEAKRKFEETQTQIELQRQKKEKQEFMDAKRRMLEQLERDKMERFGKKGATTAGATAGPGQVEAASQKKDPVEQIKHGIKTVETLYTEDRLPGIAKTCFKTISVYISNVLKNPDEEKFRKINLGNEAFQKRVGKINGALAILKGAGFEDGPDNMLHLEHPDPLVLNEAANPFSNLVQELDVEGSTYKYYSIQGLKDERVPKLPYSIRVLLESALRNCDEFNVKSSDIETILNWTESSEKDLEIPFKPARVILQDFTGVPAVVDLAAMRDATQRLGGDPKLINPLCPVDLVIDHSVQVDYAGTQDAKDRNEELEFQRNEERFSFLKWGNSAFNNFLIVPPGSGIVHQVNLEYLARVVFNTDGVLYPDSVVGTDSHTTMINGLGVVGWGVGGIEAEAVMLGQTISMVLPKVVGFKLVGNLPVETTATDLVLTVTQLLRKRGVVGQFVEFFGPGCQNLTLADRATVANMSPEYGATMGYFPIDEQTLDYLRMTGRDDHKVKQVEQYLRAQGLFRLYDGSQPDPNYSGAIMELDLSTIKSCLAGPKRPHDRVELTNMQKDFLSCLTAPVGFKGYSIPQENLGVTSKFTFNGEEFELTHGSVVISAITSCTNTSNPDVMLAAGILAENAVKRGLSVKPYIKTSLSPGSGVVTQYLQLSGVAESLDKLGFTTAGYGCMTCIGNSGDLHEAVSEAITKEDLVAASVLSGNRNFEGRVHPLTRANYLGSPPLVVAYALAGTVNIDFETQPLGKDTEGKDVYLREIWPSRDDVQKVTNKTITPVLFKEAYDKIAKGTDRWNNLQAPQGLLYKWDESSTYIHNPPFFQAMTKEVGLRDPIKDAYVLALFGDSITTDHISPAGNISKTSPAAKYLNSKGVQPKDFNSYGARRGNDEIMARGTFANVRLVNKMVDKAGPKTVYVPTGETMEIFDAAEKYQQEGKQLIIIAGQEYGSGSSRDWAAKQVECLMLITIQGTLFTRSEGCHCRKLRKNSQKQLTRYGNLTIAIQGCRKRIDLWFKGNRNLLI